MSKLIQAILITIFIAVNIALVIYGRFFWPPEANSQTGAEETVIIDPEQAISENETENDGTNGAEIDTENEEMEPIDEESTPENEEWRSILDRSLIQGVSGFTYLQQNSAGFSVAFTAGTVQLEDAPNISIEESQVEIPDQGEWHIALDLHDLSLHAFPHAHHSGAVYLAQVTADSNGVIDVQQTAERDISATHIGQTQDVLLNEETEVKIAVLGERQLTNTAVEEDWIRLLFDADLDSTDFTLPNVDNITVDHYGLHGGTPHFGMMQLGQAVGIGELVSEEGSRGENQLRSGAYDLVIASFTAFTGEMDLAYMENIVRTLRQAGTEVILVTPATGLLDTGASEGSSPSMEAFAEFAHMWEVELADAFSYVSESFHLHPDQLGDEHVTSEYVHQAWASAVRSVFAVREREDSDLSQDLFPVSRAVHPTEAVPTQAQVQFRPLQLTGVEQAGTVTDPFHNPAIGYGDRDADDYIIQLTPGQEAYFAHENALSLDLLVDPSSAFEANIIVGNTETVISRISADVDEEQELGIVEGITQDRYADYPFLYETGLRIQVTSGTLRAVGAVFYVSEE